jgi:hypothetical protein
MLSSEDLKDVPLTTEDLEGLDTLFRRPEW